MTAKEVRVYKNTCKKLVEIEERAKLLEELKKRNLCLRDEELFTQNFVNKFKDPSNKFASVYTISTQYLVSSLCTSTTYITYI